MIKVAYHISEGEYSKAMRSLWISRRLFIYAIIAVVFLLLNTLMIDGEYGLTAFSWIFPLLIMLVVWVGIIIWSFKRTYRKSAFSKGKVYYGFSDAAIEFTSPDSDGTLKWTAFQKVKESKAFYFMYTSNVTAIIIPKRAFDSTNDHDAFRNLLISKSLLKG
jgi:uncharacterized integral membrane protein